MTDHLKPKQNPYVMIFLFFSRIHQYVFTNTCHSCMIKCQRYLIHWDRVTHICISNTYQHWFRYWLVAWPVTSHYLNLCWNTGPLRTNFSEILIQIYTFSLTKIRLKMSSVKWLPFSLCLNVLKSLLIEGNDLCRTDNLLATDDLDHTE